MANWPFHTKDCALVLPPLLRSLQTDIAQTYLARHKERKLVWIASQVPRSCMTDT